LRQDHKEAQEIAQAGARAKLAQALRALREYRRAGRQPNPGYGPLREFRSRRVLDALGHLAKPGALMFP